MQQGHGYHGETEAGAGWAVPRVLMENRELQPTIPQDPVVLQCPSPRLSSHPAAPISGYTVAQAPQGWGLEHPGLSAPTHADPPEHTHLQTHQCLLSPLAGELSIKIGRTQLAGRAPARIVHSLSLTHHFVDAHKLLHYLF